MEEGREGGGWAVSSFLFFCFLFLFFLGDVKEGR